LSRRLDPSVLNWLPLTVSLPVGPL